MLATYRFQDLGEPDGVIPLSVEHKLATPTTNGDEIGISSGEVLSHQSQCVPSGVRNVFLLIMGSRCRSFDFDHKTTS